MMDRIPPEVIVMICGNLPRADLKSFRLVSRTVKGLAEPVLYRTIYLRYNLRSFERCQHIANHEKYRKHVRYLDYDVTCFGAGAFVTVYTDVGLEEYLGFENWREQFLGTGIGGGRLNDDEEDEQKQRFLLMDRLKLWQSYEAWLKCMRGELHLSTDDNTEKLFAAVLPKLSGLVGFECGPRFAKRWAFRCEDTLPFESLSPVAQEMLCEPDYADGHYTGQFHFWDLLKSNSRSGKPNQLKDVSLSGISLEAWDKGFEDTAFPVDFFKFISGLRTLSLEFSFDHDQTSNPTTNLSNMIRCSSSLRTLRLSVDVVYFDDVIRLSEIINQAQHWEHLSELSLEGFHTTEGDLCRILSKHAKTLRSFALMDVEFRGPKPGSKRQSYGSWVSFFEFLNRCMTLERAIFDGAFTNRWDEVWVAGDRNRRFRPDCLKYRVERFATRRGPFPFIRNPGAFSIYRVPLHWQYNYDVSWKFERSLLP